MYVIKFGDLYLNYDLKFTFLCDKTKFFNDYNSASLFLKFNTDLVGGAIVSKLIVFDSSVLGV